MTALLLLAAPLVPLLLLGAMAVPAWRARAAALIWAAPLPGLACAVFAAPDAALVVDARLRLGLAIDAPGALLLGAASLLWCAAGVYARAYLAGPGFARFAAWWLATLSGSMGVFVAADLVGFYLAFTLASLPAWGLVIHDRTAQAVRAGALYVLLAVLGEAALLAAFALLAASSPGESLAIADVLRALDAAPLRDVTIALLVTGFGLKAGLVPLHVWLPIAHPAAPMPASAVLSGAIIKAGVIGLLRFLPIGTTPAGWGEALVVIGFVTAFWGVACGVVQRNPKAVLAYSSVSQMGVVVAAFGMGIAGGMAATPGAVAFYALHHVLAKGALFLAVGVAAASGARALVLVPAVVLALGFGGLPLTGGWLAKEAVKGELGHGVVGLLAAVSAAGSTVLMLHFVRRLSFAQETAARPAPALLLPWLALAAACVLLPWALFPGSLAEVLAPDALLKALVPVLAGAALVLPLARWGARLPVPPEGDIMVVVAPLRAVAVRAGDALARAEAVLRGWSAAGLALLVLVLALGVALMAR
ncbi:complex I subunit 5 family protein [Roseomonas sp. CECT 9278]|uniref:complex I subunit 5 family protein n=1 Tax=Roseomonas sp. CECT 9278 TaxID=2845823 RepID=UPI001E63C2EB|nr:complex I subunit 5 family protein [Roseomonas sp. CECT 9278]CAH0281405.1 NAD(P)H-quinone oxidoreductase subunit 2, chloroplastic [Roseomonas sp. CECT 9278]